jgi:hypothetical protein
VTPEAELLAAVDGDATSLSGAAIALAERAELLPLLGRRGGPFAQKYREALARGLHTQAQTEHLVARLGVPAVALKGAALVELVYDSPGERTMGDVDLLVPGPEWRRACEAIGGRELVTDGRPITSRHDYCRAFRADGDVTFELHRYLAPRPLFAVDTAGILDRARPSPRGLLVPSPEDLLLSLCVHAAKHGFELPLRAVVDTRRVVARLRPDGRIVAARALDWRAARATLAWLRRCGVATLVEPHLRAGAAPTAGAGGRLPRVLLATDHPLYAAAYVTQRATLRAADLAVNAWSAWVRSAWPT